MSDGAYHRKKEPEAVRRALLDSAALVAASEGFAAVTIQAVADAANVTKGGLFHHFPSKAALVEAMLEDQLAKFDAAIDDLIAADPLPKGCFTRAYVETVFNTERFGVGTEFGAMATAITADATMRSLWEKWLADRLARHAATDSGRMLEIVRLAADGAWYAYMADARPGPNAAEIHRTLIELTVSLAHGGFKWEARYPMR